jgi:hypothetical protein
MSPDAGMIRMMKADGCSQRRIQRLEDRMCGGKGLMESLVNPDRRETTRNVLKFDVGRLFSRVPTYINPTEQ